ncbi:MAG: hypothetical protein RMK29_13240 [Myxococcales bacterium]|nr:hypothetical protein [Myxococcota bacterium]MDW8282671.1 hypothetical protein [Myxococcales bacterium]
MRLVLAGLPATWRPDPASAGGAVLRAPEGLVLHVAGLVPVPADYIGAQEELLRLGVPSGGTLRVHEDLLGETDLGWPMRRVLTEVVDPEGRVLEVRLHAFYQFLYYAAHAVAVSPDPAVLRAHLPLLTEALGRGRPDWRSDQVVAVEEIFSFEVEAAGSTMVSGP